MTDKSQLEPSDPTAFNNPGRQTLIDADSAGLGRALLTLTKELWVLKDRLQIMEAVLEKHGLSISEEIDNFQPDAELQAKLNDDGKALVRSVLNALNSD